MYGNVPKLKCWAIHWVEAKKETKRNNKKKKKKREKEQAEERKEVRSTTRDATQARPPIQIPTAVLLRQTGSTAAGIRENLKKQKRKTTENHD